MLYVKRLGERKVEEALFFKTFTGLITKPEFLPFMLWAWIKALHRPARRKSFK